MPKLDKYYTKPEIAAKCYEYLQKRIKISEQTFLEPSAGGGVFLPLLPRYEAYDILPEGENITQADFLQLELPRTNYITIGNPPFGKRSKLAIEFFNHAAKFSTIIAFIVPVSFMKWSVQKELDWDFHLMDYLYLPENSFLFEGKDYSIRCVFQIWVRGELSRDLRLQKAPSISHPDFQLWQYNATQEAKKYVDKDWEFALYRQGYKDYSKIFTKNDYNEIKIQMEQNIQFFFIKPLTKQAKEFVYSADFASLAMRNTSTPGFGKADFVSYYEEFLRNKISF